MELHLTRLLAIAVGGALGALGRYAIVAASVRLLGDGDRFPLGVLVANVAGCFLLGLLMHDAVIENRLLTAAGHAGLTVGLLGALTTFSTFGYDTLRLMEAGRHVLAATNVLANCTLGIAACALGAWAGGKWWGG